MNHPTILSFSQLVAATENGSGASQMMEIFETLHESVNDPQTRDHSALPKAQLIYQLALTKLNRRQVRDFSLEIISATDEVTSTLTHNVMVTFGDPKTGPNLVVEVHHDTIYAADRSLWLEDGRLFGRTIQDNTLHLAATLDSLDKVATPPSGSLIIVFTDHEENGCRGSAALSQTLLERVTSSYPVALLALESTNGKVALGHKGKFSAELISETQDVSSHFLNFCSILLEVEEEVFKQSQGESLLGESSGTSTYGFVNKDQLLAKLDFRTNEQVTPEIVSEVWQKTSEDLERSSPLVKCLQFYKQDFIRIEVDHKEIILTSKSTVFHPSQYCPEDNQTVIPGLYLALSALSTLGLSSQVETVQWGEEDNQNSVPVTAKITGVSIDLDDLNLAIEGLIQNPVDTLSKPKNFEISLDGSKTILTDCVLSPVDARSDKVAGKEVLIVNYMTDIAKLFNLLKSRGQLVYGFIFGMGDPAKLHGVEQISPSDVVSLHQELPQLFGRIHSALTETLS